MTDEELEREPSLALVLASAEKANANSVATQALVTERFKDIQRQLNLVTSLPKTVAVLGSRLEEAFRRIGQLEAEDSSREQTSREWWRTHFPSLVVAVAALAVAILTGAH